MTQPAADYPDETDVEDITNVLLSEEDEARFDEAFSAIASV